MVVHLQSAEAEEFLYNNGSDLACSTRITDGFEQGGNQPGMARDFGNFAEECGDRCCLMRRDPARQVHLKHAFHHATQCWSARQDNAKGILEHWLELSYSYIDIKHSAFQLDPETEREPVNYLTEALFLGL